MRSAFLILCALAAAGLASADNEKLVPFLAGGTTVAKARLEGAPKKPYVKQIFTPAGVALLDDSPPDHFHHHGLMLALGVDKTDFWAEKDQNNIGVQHPLETKSLPLNQGSTQIIRWLSQENKNLLDEARVVRVLQDKDPAVNWVVWKSTLTPAAKVESVELNGRHYFGLGMRFLPPFAKATRFQFLGGGEARVVRGDERLTPGRACAATARVEGKPVTLVMFDHAKNPRPALWFTMGEPFSYLSATQNLEEKPQKLAKGESWTLCYGVATLDGEADEAQLAALEKRWKEIAENP